MVKKISGTSPKLTKSVAVGLALAISWTLIAAMVIAKLVDAELLAMENVGYGSMITVLAAVFFGATAAGKRAGNMVIQAAVMAGIGYFACLLLVNALFFGGSYAGLGTTAILVLIAVGLCILMMGKGSRKRPERRYKIPKG